MDTTHTPGERLELVDRQVNQLKHRFVEAIDRLQRSDEVDESFEERLMGEAERLRELRQQLVPDDYDKEQLNELHQALWEINDLLEGHDGQDLETADALLVCVERIRHIVRDALDEYVGGLPDDAGLVLADIRRRLPNTPQRVIAELVGVNRRTLARWTVQPTRPSPRLALVARLVAVLRHNWTEEGIVAWFSRPRRGLGGRRPISLLGDSGRSAALLSEAGRVAPNMAPRSRSSAIAWTGAIYRATSYDVPLWSRPNRRSGRWNIAAEGATQYGSLDAETPWAEMLRHEDLRSEEEASMFRSSLWQLRADEGAIVDYSTFDKAEAAGFPPEALVDDDHDRCQAEAQWLKGHGVRGVVSPSAALPGHLNLTLFGPRVALPWGVEVRLGSTTGAQRLTTGAPPEGLAGEVRYFGEAHAGLERYVERLRGQPPDR